MAGVFELPAASRFSGRHVERAPSSPARPSGPGDARAGHAAGGGDALDTTLELDRSDVFGRFTDYARAQLATMAGPATGDGAGAGARWCPRTRRTYARCAARLHLAWSTHYFWLFLLFLAVAVSVAAYLMDAAAEALHARSVRGLVGGDPAPGAVAAYVGRRRR